MGRLARHGVDGESFQRALRGARRAAPMNGEPRAADVTPLRPYRAGHERELVDLYPRVFQHAVTVDEWRWKLKARTCPAENVWLSEANGKIVFQYAGMPVRLSIDGRELDALVSVDTMVEPSLQRSGL